MPRPHKQRRVCFHPRCTYFGPREGNGGTISIGLDEYETIRLIDFEGMTQEQCAEQMEIARTTVQSVYAQARKKLAQCIVEGRSLQIAGGNVRLCEQYSSLCEKGRCCMKNCKNGKEG